MSREYKPSFPFNVPFVLLTPTHTTLSGVSKKTFPTVQEALQNENNIFHGNFKTYGGTVRTIGDVNGLVSIEDTGNVETWFRPDIKSDCRVARAIDGAIFDIINEPENINMMNQFLKFTIRRVKGGV